MKLEEKSDRWFKEKYGNEGFTYIEEEIRKICFEDGYKECEKEKEECQDFIWESLGFKKRGFVNSIQIAEYIEKLEKENAELEGIKDVATLIRANNDTVVTLMQLNNKLVSKSQQLTKAREIIAIGLRVCDTSSIEYMNLYQEQAEQFLKEGE